MAIDIKPRHIRVLRELSISEVTDEEIVKATMDRLKVDALMIAYMDRNRWQFIWRYNAGFGKYPRRLIEHIKKWFDHEDTRILSDEE